MNTDTCTKLAIAVSTQTTKHVDVYRFAYRYLGSPNLGVPALVVCLSLKLKLCQAG